MLPCKLFIQPSINMSTFPSLPFSFLVLPYQSYHTTLLANTSAHAKTKAILLYE